MGRYRPDSLFAFVILRERESILRRDLDPRHGRLVELLDPEQRTGGGLANFEVAVVIAQLPRSRAATPACV